MAAESARALESLRFAIDSTFVDDTVYTYQSPDGRSSVCVEFEPIRDPATDTAARRLERAAEELTRVYDAAQISAPVPLATGAGVALVMRAQVLGDVEIGAAGLELGTVRVYVTATTEGSSTSAFPIVVESIRVIGQPEPATPPGYRRTGAGTVSLCVPASWTAPSVVRYRAGSAVVEIGLGIRRVDLSPAELVAVAPDETVVLDEREETSQSRGGLTLGATVATYTVRSPAGVPRDAIMLRTTDVALEADRRRVAYLLGAAKSVDWPSLIQAWGPLVASVVVES